MSEYRGVKYEFVDTTGTFFPPGGGMMCILKREGWTFKACAEKDIDNWLEDHPDAISTDD